MDCGRRGSWIASPWTLARARAFTVPFGKFKGRTIADLIGTTEGAQYLKWAAVNVEGNAGTAAAVTLGLRPADIEGLTDGA